jgi:hypothetical protein
MFASQKWAFVLVALVAFGSAPRVAADDEKPPSVEGTEWVGPDLPEQFVTTYRFEKGGKLVYHYNGTTYDNGTWKQDGDKVYFEVNDKYREAKLKIKGDTLSGDSWNTTGKKWTTTVYKYTKPKKAGD